MFKERPELLPILIADEERLARAIFHPSHLKNNGKLKASAFKAKAGRNDVSVNRLWVLNCNECKAHARAISINGIFKGFAVLTARTIRECGSGVKDSRELFLGHADIIHDIVLEKDMPAPAEFNERLNRMAASAKIYLDQIPEDERWFGEDFSAI